ncbi:MAG: type II toxin-antitoxin system HicB family antitoxin [Zoogloeaceae bacterium]|jgi:predicted HicB family RNase H-like nuclease|nr:type II toxin-antitoxin system HicB family antitoxin [Zoogloeaceae bacterium]
MKNTLSYKGFVARVEFDDRDGIFIGRVLGARDVISFHAETVADLRREFKISIEDYLAYCAEHGKKPEKPASGKLMLRIPPEVHATALVAARSEGKSLNQWAAETLAQAARAPA